ncbi:putative MIF4G-like, type 3, initiation factor eIF-4 gamma, MA3, MIF4G-like domain superfamily [Helianthus annuus]|uniref:Eukaryotic translation initiation factor 4G n=1 Tax=Helianthus annuus TaxID=4232 RepID=A0A251SL11_HELAN|nr:eukaryotic translation initiation factor 4G isoform X1 [Helianthus annuus]KAF5761256.1 putative MIF4G-like, type 3, initiation factor eIF-4 gamma, MA3, MIF4G-like domain superfamily [Helianthus annuus]
MSVNQSRSENNEPPHYRRSGRYGNPASGKSFKKVVSNAQGVQGRVTVSNPKPNGAHVQQPLRAIAGAPGDSPTGAVVKPTDASVQKSTAGLPKAPQSNVAPLNSGTTGPSTPLKGPADASKAFSLQFGSISPGVINGLQLPARTSSAPPNLDEQKLQASLDSFKAISFQNSVVPKQHSPRKDSGTIDQPREAHPISKEKKDTPSSLLGPVAAHDQKYTGSFITSIPPGVSMQTPYHQPQAHLQFGGPNPPLQVPPQVFFPGIQHHQGIAHQSQGLTFSSQMGPMNLYTNSYNAGALLPPPSGFKPLTIAQMTPGSQPLRFHNQQASKQVTVKQPVISSHAEKAVDSIDKSQISNKSKRQGQPLKDSETIGVQSSSVGVQETSKPSTFSVRISKDMSETSNRVEGLSKGFADLSASKCDNDEKSLNPTQVNGNTIKVDVEVPIAKFGGSKEQVQEVKRNQDNTVLDLNVAPLKKHVDNIDGNAILSKVKGHTTAKGKKKIKEILKNADARGTTSDLYNAYKRPEEKMETSAAAEIVENPNPSVNSTSGTSSVLSSDRAAPSKFEPDDWEDAADISTLKIDTGSKSKHHSEDDDDGMTKKYSRDFLLTFSDHCTDLPEGFKITHDITEVLVVTGVNMAREPYPNPVRGGGDRSVMGSRLDRRPSNIGLDDKWNKGSGGPMGPGWDPSRGSHGVLRTPHGQPPGQYAGGILSGPMQFPGPQLQRNNSESERWQRATGYQKGLMPSPHTPMMHKAERKYEVGKVTDEEQAKQRRLKSILNKLTPQNFEKLFDQVKQVNIDNANTLSGVIGQIFDKALMEPTFVEMYANFCSHLSVELPGFVDDNEKITFKRLLLNKCQEEFERGEREEEEANRTEEEGEIKQTEEEREEKRVKARRRMLGNIRFIGELYKKRMLTERIMHECIKKLLGFNQKNPNPDEEDIEALCKLMSTIGEMIDHPQAKEHMDAYFVMMFQLSNNMALSSRVRFMLKDAIDLRKNKWQQRRKVEGPKKIEEVHRDAAQERQAQSSRLARGPSSNPSLRRGGQPMDFGPRGSAGALSSNPQMGGGFRGYGSQDSRFDSFENRTLSVLLRPMGDEAITLGPQGGLARGMSVRGQPTNGYGGSMIRGGHGPSRDDLASRYMPERFSPRPTYDPHNIQHNNVNHGNQDTRNIGRGVFDRVLPPERARASTSPQSDSSDKILSEDRLHGMSIEAIKEFYSARDEKEVALCIKDLNAPGFHPTMISIWVTDSFERKDMDRDLLAKLLISLTKSQGILTRESLIRGLESVMSTLEDAVNDAPKAAEFLGRMLAQILLENVIPYKEVWRLIHEGGEEQGRLVELGLAAEVVGVILEIIKSEKGDPFLIGMRAASNLRVEVFRSSKTSRLDKFI